MRYVVAAVLALVVAAPASAACRVGKLENEIICPVCKPETLAQSDSPIAQRMKHVIAQRCAAGATEGEVKDYLVANFGKGVLAAPPTHGFDLLAWWLPIGGVLVAAAALGVLAWRWSSGRNPRAAPAAPEELDPELARRVDEALARFDH